MSPLRQALIVPSAASHLLAAMVSDDRRRNHDRRTSERRTNVHPFETREARMRFAAQAAGFGVYDLDCTTGDSIWSPELRTMAGLAPDTTPLSTEQAESLIHPDDRQRFMDKLRASLEPNSSGEFEDEYRLLRPDGAFRWVRTKGRTFFIGEGEARLPLAATGIVMDLSASRAAAQQLAESREELDKMAEAAIDAIVTIDVDQRITRFNRSAEHMFGCPASQALGSRVERFMPERYRATHAEKVRRFAKSDSSAHMLDSPMRFIGLRESGEEFYFEATITKVDIDGQSRMTTFMREITDRVRAEQELRRSKEDLELAVRGANIGIWHIDIKTQTVEWSDRQYQLFGIPTGAPIDYKSIMATVHPDDRVQIQTAARQAMHDGSEYHVEFRVVWPDGSIHWIESIGRFFFDQGETEAKVMRGIAFDVTERRLTEEALQRSKADLEMALRGAHIGVWEWDLPKGFFDLSGRCHELFDIPHADGPVSFERVLAAIHPDDRERVKASLQQALETGEEYRFEKRIVWSDGSIHWLQCMARDLYDEVTGEVIGMRGVSIDVTERRNYEDALRHSNEDLEYRVKERTAELTHASEALERSNVELQQFAFIAAHDLQTPLRSISGFAQLLRNEYQGRLDKQADVWLEHLVRSARRMHDLIRDVLTYSRVESRGNAFQPTDLNSLCDEVVESLDASIREIGGQVTRDQLPTVLGDRTQLGQVFQNLIENGLKYHGEKVPQVHVSALQKDQEWVVSIQDNGIGIPEKHLERIFDIFQRLHTVQEYSGTGIGLAVCRRIIYRHGGRIWVESTPGEGSTFYFTVPEMRFSPER